MWCKLIAKTIQSGQVSFTFSGYGLVKLDGAKELLMVKLIGGGNNVILLIKELSYLDIYVERHFDSHYLETNPVVQWGIFS